MVSYHRSTKKTSEYTHHGDGRHIPIRQVFVNKEKEAILGCYVQSDEDLSRNQHFVRGEPVDYRLDFLFLGP